MKNPFLFGIAGITLVAVTATTLYAQTTTGTSIIDKMKEAMRPSFTLSADLNPGQTGYESAPVSGKKTGNMLTAAEWNRMLEIISQGSMGAGGSGGAQWINVPLTDITDFDTACFYEVQIKTTDTVNNNLMNGDTSWRTATIRGNKYLSLAFTDSTGPTVWGIQSSNKGSFGSRNASGTFTAQSSVSVLGVRKLCGNPGNTTSNGGISSNLLYINPDNTDFAPLECTPGINYMINPIAFSAASASTYTDKKLAVLKPGNWRAKGTNFSRNRNITSGSSHTLRFNSILDGVTSKLYENTVDLGLYASSFSKDITVPAGKTAEINVSVRNNTIYGGTVTVWCTN